jgi:hypothetical protein
MHYPPMNLGPTAAVVKNHDCQLDETRAIMRTSLNREVSLDGRSASSLLACRRTFLHPT